MPTTSPLAPFQGYSSYQGFVGPFAVGSNVWDKRSKPAQNLTQYPAYYGTKVPINPADPNERNPSVIEDYGRQMMNNYYNSFAAQGPATFNYAGASPFATGGSPGQASAPGMRIPAAALLAGGGAAPGATGQTAPTPGVPAPPPPAAGPTRKAAVGATEGGPAPATNDPIGAYLSNLFGTTQGGSGIWGSVPNVPDPNATAGAAISGDIANLGNLFGLAGATNTFNNQQAINPYIANLPGYQGMVGQSSQNIMNELQGKLPPDVIALMQQQGAEGGVGQGMGPGSDNVNSAYLRALGLTSLGQEQQGEQNLTSAIQRTPTAPLFNVASFMNTPADQQAAQMMANIYASAPNPQQQGQ